MVSPTESDVCPIPIRIAYLLHVQIHDWRKDVQSPAQSIIPSSRPLAMSNYHSPLRLVFLLALLTFAELALGQDAPTVAASPDPNKPLATKSAEYKWALAFTKKNADDSTLESELKAYGAPSGSWHDNAVKFVAAMRSAAAQGLVPDSPAFVEAVLGESVAITKPAVATPRELRSYELSDEQRRKHAALEAIAEYDRLVEEASALLAYIKAYGADMNREIIARDNLKKSAGSENDSRKKKEYEKEAEARDSLAKAFQSKIDVEIEKLALVRARQSQIVSIIRLADLKDAKTDPEEQGRIEQDSAVAGRTGKALEGSLKALQRKRIPMLQVAEQRPSHDYAQLGTRLLSPYKLTVRETTAETATADDPVGTKHFLISSEAPELRLYFELGYLWSWVSEPTAVQQMFPHPKDPEKYFIASLRPDNWNFQGRISFQFDSSKEASVNTIMGYGDVNTEISFDKPFLFGLTTDGAWTLGPGGSLAATSDRQGRTIHLNYFAGPVLNLSMGAPEGMGMVDDKKHRLKYFRMGLGWSRLDHIVYKPGSTEEIIFDGNIPKYEASWSFSMEAEMRYPLGDSGMLTAGARLYSGIKPSPWVLYFGYTVDPFKIFNSFVNPGTN